LFFIGIGIDMGIACFVTLIDGSYLAQCNSLKAKKKP